MRPTLFYIGSFPVHAFGLFVLAGFLVGLKYASWQARKEIVGRKPDEPGLITPEHVFDMCIVGLFCGIIGARILYIALDWNEFSGSIVDVFKIWTGGISVHGAIVGSTLYCWYYTHKHKLSFFRFADICAPGLAIGYTIGRIGCFLNGCCYGAACDLPWAVRFVRDGREGFLTPPSHPTQIYASIMNLAIFGYLHWRRQKKHAEGEIILSYFALYLVYRFIDEIFRRGATADIFVLNMTHSQAFSVVALPFVLFAMYRRKKARVIDPDVPYPA